MPDSNRELPLLLIFSGLPGAGKSTLAKLIARELKATYLRIDTIEQGLRDLCSFQVEGEGYRLAYRIAGDNLRLGQTVVSDSCNPIELTRREWEWVARDAGVPFVNIEVICSNNEEHRRRVASRSTEIDGLQLPTWKEVQNREYHNWTVDRIVVDTHGRSEAECLAELRERLKATDVPSGW